MNAFPSSTFVSPIQEEEHAHRNTKREKRQHFYCRFAVMKKDDTYNQHNHTGRETDIRVPERSFHSLRQKISSIYQ